MTSGSTEVSNAPSVYTSHIVLTFRGNSSGIYMNAERVAWTIVVHIFHEKPFCNLLQTARLPKIFCLDAISRKARFKTKATVASHESSKYLFYLCLLFNLRAHALEARSHIEELLLLRKARNA